MGVWRVRWEKGRRGGRLVPLPPFSLQPQGVHPTATLSPPVFGRESPFRYVAVVLLLLLVRGALLGLEERKWEERKIESGCLKEGKCVLLQPLFFQSSGSGSIQFSDWVCARAWVCPARTARLQEEDLFPV